jgi:hypothetical protein
MHTVRKLLSTFFAGILTIGFVGILIFSLQFVKGNSATNKSAGTGGHQTSMDQYSAKNFIELYPAPASSNPKEKSVQPYPEPKQTDASKELYLPPVQRNRIQITPTSAPIADDGWYVFSENDTGYSFHYPPGSHLSSGKGPRIPYTSVTLEYHVPNEISYHGMTIMVYPNTDRLTPSEYAEEIYKETAQSKDVSVSLMKNSESVQIANLPALKVVIPPTLTDFTLILPYKDRMIVLSPMGDPMILNDPVKDEALEIFTKIVSTFKLKP